MEGRGKSRERQRDRTNGSGWYRGESSKGRTRELQDQVQSEEDKGDQLPWQIQTKELQNKQIDVGRLLTGLLITVLPRYLMPLSLCRRRRWLEQTCGEVIITHLIRKIMLQDALLFTSIVIAVGNSMNTPFWEARWLNGAAPKDLAPNIYRQAHYNYRTVHKELQNLIGSRISGV
jgi:hypothetical protein